MTISVIDFLKKAADRNGFHRDRFEQARIPTDYSDIVIMPLFGDLRSICIASSLLLHRVRQEKKGSKYFILASWPGFQGLFPYVDEYWSLTDEAHLKRFYEQSENFNNKSDLYAVYLRNLNEFFRETMTHKDINIYYNNGITDKFFDTFKETKMFFPFMPSVTALGKEFNRELAVRPGYKVFIHPSIFIKKWSTGKSQNVRAKREFWVELVKYLISKNYVPVIWQNYLAYDISQDFVDKCIFVGEKDAIRAMTAMRATGCVLDVFNNLSRLSLLARCPYISVDERSRTFYQKEYEWDCLCGKNLSKEYIYSFSTIVSDGSVENWSQDIFSSIFSRLERFIPDLDRENWPSTGEITEVVSYKDLVIEKKQKKLGTRFINVPKE
jgi:hypothetical protein